MAHQTIPDGYDKVTLDIAVWGSTLGRRVDPATLFAQVQSFAVTHERKPTLAEVDANPSLPSAYILLRHFGSWKTITDTINLESLGDPQKKWEALGRLERGGRAPQQQQALSDAMHRGHVLQPQVDRLMAEVRATQKTSSMTLDEFRERLQAVDPKRAAILDNLITPGGERRTRGALAKILKIGSTSVERYEASLVVLCNDMGWNVVALPSVRQVTADSTKTGKALQLQEDELIAMVRRRKTGKRPMTHEEFQERLLRIDPDRAVVFANVTDPNQGRKSHQSLAKDVKVSSATIHTWEKRYHSLCAEMEWSVVPLPEERRALADRIQRGRDTESAIRALIKEAVLSRGSDRSMGRNHFRERLQKIDPHRAAVFDNITTPKGGRMSRKNMAVLLPVSDVTIGNWEMEFEELCRQMNWKVVTMPKQRQVAATASQLGKRLQGQVDALMAEARTRRDSPNPVAREEFQNRLQEIDSNRAMVFVNLTVPVGERQSSAALDVPSKVGHQTLRNWEVSFESLCLEMGWKMAPVPVARHLQSKNAQEGQVVASRIRTLERAALRMAQDGQTMSREVFRARLEGIDPARSAIFDSLFVPSGTAKQTLSQMAVSLEVSVQTVVNWRSHFKSFFKRMGWELTGGSQRGMATVDMMALPVMAVWKGIPAIFRTIQMPVTVGGVVQEAKGTGVTLTASLIAQIADAWWHNDWRGVQQTSVKSLALDGAAIFGSGAVSEALGRVAIQKIPERILSTSTRTLGLSGLKLGAASAFLQLLHNDHVSFGEMALNVGSGVAYQIAVGRMLGVLDSLGLKATARFFSKTPGTILLSAVFMFGMQQLHRQTVADELAPALNQARSAVVELFLAEAKIREAQRMGVIVEPQAIATVQGMMSDYIQQLKKLPDVDEVILYRDHIQELAAIRESAQEASVAVMASPDPTSAMSQIDHNEVVETQRENRKFAERLASLHEKLIQSGRNLPSLQETTEFLTEPRYADLDNNEDPSQSVDELLSHNFSGMAAQLEDYLKASI